MATQIRKTPLQLMKRALLLARRGHGDVEPNPMVGAVIVRRGEIVAEGWHHRFGDVHGEIDALQKLANPRGCEMYVTLEPCCHQGKTGPCVKAIIKAGLSVVHVAMQDPFKQVAGQGIAQLKQAGIKVQVGLCEQESRELNAPFIKRVTTKLPWVVAKWAQTLDGFIATRSGNSQWISNEKSRRFAHQCRSCADAIIVGIGTVLADDPQLLARDVKVHRVARRVVVDPLVKTPLHCKLLSTLSQAPVTLVVDQAAIEKRHKYITQLKSQGVEFIYLTRNPKGNLKLKPLLKKLVKQHQATQVIVEGGSRLLGSFFEQKLVDQVHVYVAPKLLTDPAGLPPASCDAVLKMAQALDLKLHQVKRFDDDMLLDYRVD